MTKIANSAKIQANYEINSRTTSNNNEKDKLGVFGYGFNENEPTTTNNKEDFNNYSERTPQEIEKKCEKPFG